jgi:pimeloyl-ACP methyl ester carboxylesterase
MNAGAAPPIRRGYADTTFGQLHYAECGAGAPIVLLHQTPRSWDEYREVLPILGRSHRAIAIDTVGFGASATLASHTIEAYACSIVGVLDALNLRRTVLVGHHTGGVVAVEVTAQVPERIERLVLSSTPYVDEPGREMRRRRPPIDHVDVDPDGTHLVELWQRRQRYYPAGRADLLARFVRDALALDPADLEKGHQAVAGYVMEDRIGSVRCPVLCIGASADPHGFPELAKLTAALPNAQVAVVEGGMVPLMEAHADEIAKLILEFIG